MMPFPVFFPAQAAGASGTVLLQIQPTGADSSTSFTDQSTFARTLTAQGNMQVDTGVLDPFGQPTMLSDGTGDFVTAVDAAEWDLGTGQFTIEAWINLNFGAFRNGFIAKGDTSGNPGSDWYFRIFNGQLQFGFYESATVFGANVDGAGGSYSTGTWYHVAVCRDALGNFSLFDSGVRRRYQTGISTKPIYKGTQPIRVADSTNAGPSIFGNIGPLRVTKGVALYDGATYTVPTARFPTP